MLAITVQQVKCCIGFAHVQAQCWEDLGLRWWAQGGTMSILNNKPWREHCGQALAVVLAEQSQLMLDATWAVYSNLEEGVPSFLCAELSRDPVELWMLIPGHYARWSKRETWN